jgi:hypothetical protein
MRLWSSKRQERKGSGALALRLALPPCRSYPQTSLQICETPPMRSALAYSERPRSGASGSPMPVFGQQTRSLGAIRGNALVDEITRDIG